MKSIFIFIIFFNVLGLYAKDNIDQKLLDSIKLWDHNFVLATDTLFDQDIKAHFTSGDPTQRPFISEGDYNGDNINDYVLIVISEKLKLVKFILALYQPKIQKYDLTAFHETALIKDEEDTISTYISKIDKDALIWENNDTKKDIFQIEIYLELVHAYIYNGTSVIRSNKNIKGVTIPKDEIKSDSEDKETV